MREQFAKEGQKILNMINFGKEQTDKNAEKLTYSQFCMAAMNETVHINEEKMERAFDLFDIVSIISHRKIGRRRLCII